MNSLSISHSTQASIAPLLDSSMDSSLPSHLMLAASNVQEAYSLTSCGVLATPPTTIWKDNQKTSGTGRIIEESSPPSGCKFASHLQDGP